MSALLDFLPLVIAAGVAFGAGYARGAWRGYNHAVRAFRRAVNR